MLEEGSARRQHASHCAIAPIEPSCCRWFCLLRRLKNYFPGNMMPNINTETKTERVPAPLQSKCDEIVALTDQFCQQHLNEEYRDLCRALAAKLCRKRPSPVLSGNVNTWACGIAYALGRVNFLFDLSQKPHMQAVALCECFGLSASTGGAKSKAIMNAMKMRQMDPHWTLPSLLQEDPMVRLVRGLFASTG